MNCGGGWAEDGDSARFVEPGVWRTLLSTLSMSSCCRTPNIKLSARYALLDYGISPILRNHTQSVHPKLARCDEPLDFSAMGGGDVSVA